MRGQLLSDIGSEIPSTGIKPLAVQPIWVPLTNRFRVAPRRKMVHIVGIEAVDLGWRIQPMIRVFGGVGDAAAQFGPGLDDCDLYGLPRRAGKMDRTRNPGVAAANDDDGSTVGGHVNRTGTRRPSGEGSG